MPRICFDFRSYIEASTRPSFQQRQPPTRRFDFRSSVILLAPGRRFRSATPPQATSESVNIRIITNSMSGSTTHASGA